MIDVKIGIARSGKELEIELPDSATKKDVVEAIKDCLENGTTIWLTDRKDREYAIAAANVAYVEVGDTSSGRRVGFGAS